MLACASAACGFDPSRAPLGGDYRLPETASTAKHRPRADAAPTPSHGTEISETPPDKQAPAPATSAASKSASAVSESKDALRYEPLKTGDQLREDVSLLFSAEIQGGSSDVHGSQNQIVLDAKLHADVKVLKSSAQSLDELEVTLTPVSLHTGFAGHSADSKPDPPETFDVTLSGQTPGVRVRSGGTLRKEDRIALLVLLTPLVEFHAHWAPSPSMNLTPGWSGSVPLAPPAFLHAATETVHVGPLSLRYHGRDAGAGAGTPFDVGLPIEWITDLGTLRFECTGRASLGAKGRPVSLDLSSPITGNVGRAGSQFALHGTAKLAATVSYP